MIRHIALDFDGVLVETVDIKTEAFAQLFVDESPRMVERILAYHRAHGGISRFEKFRAIYQEILQRPLSEAECQRLGQQFAALVVDRVVVAPWVDGAEKFLLQHRGRYRFFVVSGTPEGELREILRRRAMEPFFDGVFGAPRSKDVLLRITLERCGLAPTDMAFIGDSETDWTAAREVQVPFVWRQSSTAVTLEGFTGPRIRSLAELDHCLSRLERQGALAS